MRKRNNLVHSNAYGILVIENIISVPILVYPEMYWMHMFPQYSDDEILTPNVIVELWEIIRS